MRPLHGPSRGHGLRKRVKSAEKRFTFADELVTGYYKVGADCRGTATFTPKGQPEMHFSFVVVDCGKDLLAIETDADTVVSGTLVKS